MQFEERLLAIRKEKKMSQSELAKKVGIHANVLGRYERGEARPFVEMAAKLANALEVSLDYLVGNTELELDKNTLKRIEEVSKFSDKDKEHVYVLLDAFIRDVKAKQAFGIS